MKKFLIIISVLLSVLVSILFLNNLIFQKKIYKEGSIIMQFLPDNEIELELKLADYEKYLIKETDENIEVIKQHIKELKEMKLREIEIRKIIKEKLKS